jgi:hypothetical protein
VVAVDADGEDMKFRLHGVGNTRVDDGSLGGQRHQQAASIVGCDLDAVLSAIERQGLFDLAGRSLCGQIVHGGGDAVDTPLDPPDPLTPVRDAHGDCDQVKVRLTGGGMGGDVNKGRGPAVDDRPEIDDLSRAFDLTMRSIPRSRH